MRPDLLLLDLALPDMQGWKLLDSIKAKTQTDQNLKLAEVVVITAYGDPANRLMAKLQDVADYLTKPFTPTEVEKVVARVLNLKPPDGTRPPRTDLSTTK
jgi:CheY-like chemotaxis protein